MSIPIFQFIPPPTFPPGNHKFVFYICDSVSGFNVFYLEAERGISDSVFFPSD